MRLAFAGTPQFAARALEALLNAGHVVCLVLTQPDRPSGRGMRHVESAVKQLARHHGLEMFQPSSLRDAGAAARIAAGAPEAMVVAAYGLILPQNILDLAPFGALNIHASLLPRWRGAAPIQRALLEGDRETGITIMKMDIGLDTGPILAQSVLPILPADDAGALHDRLAELGASMIVSTLADVAAGRAESRPQASHGITYAHKIRIEEAVLDWRRSAEELERRIRALSPVPGARTTLSGQTIKVWRAHVKEGDGNPGTVLESGRDAIVVACGGKALVLTELQRSGGRRLKADEFLRGSPIAAGERFDPPLP